MIKKNKILSILLVGTMMTTQNLYANPKNYNNILRNVLITFGGVGTFVSLSYLGYRICNKYRKNTKSSNSDVHSPFVINDENPQNTDTYENISENLCNAIIEESSTDIFLHSKSNNNISQEEKRIIARTAFATPTNENTRKLIKVIKLETDEKMKRAELSILHQIADRGNPDALTYLEISYNSDEIVFNKEQYSRELEDIINYNNQIDLKFENALTNIDPKYVFHWKKPFECLTLLPKIEDIIFPIYKSALGLHRKPKGLFSSYFHEFLEDGTAKNKGFKIHISAKIRNASKIATIVLEVLKNFKVQFKYCFDLPTYRDLQNFGRKDIKQISQCNKFFTIYPKDNDEANNIVEKMVLAFSESGLNETDFPDIFGDFKIKFGIETRLCYFSARKSSEFCPEMDHEIIESSNHPFRSLSLYGKVLPKNIQEIENILKDEKFNYFYNQKQ
ncbi:MAG: hypothetical protein RsTaC01_1063 [Candidatus Paraimprobicoccus trichonymphae]|uniref:RamC N-terminal domain-containing protein n=1 Tax=Candidatus Paraimprobicoccus trichonymphae TaxID=3033793 RepID=A0AA48KY59_9FIRM|nr:MAG: hypothetical protein RsTaC01_1063 [Candidatus Paraimprobicoccus trichonymphae]